jgi:hypothetical protein
VNANEAIGLLYTPDVPAERLYAPFGTEVMATILGITQPAARKRCERKWCRSVKNGREYVVTLAWIRERLLGEANESKPAKGAKGESWTERAKRFQQVGSGV